MNRTFPHPTTISITTLLLTVFVLFPPLTGKSESYTFASIEGLVEQ